MRERTQAAPARRLDRILTAVAAGIVLLLAGCGGGGGDDPIGAAPTAPAASGPTLATPTDKSTAVDYQYQAVAEARAAVEAILDRKSVV